VDAMRGALVGGDDFSSKCRRLQYGKSPLNIGPTKESSRQCGTWFNAVDWGVALHCGLLESLDV
jgi:hypothetical protein